MTTTLNFRRTHNYAAQSRQGISLPIRLSSGERSVRLLAKLDTGATNCIIQRGYAEALGLRVEDGEVRTFRTANSSFTAFGHTLMITCFEWNYETRIFFPEDPGIDRNVVGRSGWLQQFRVAIIDYDSLLHIGHYNEA